MCPGGSQSLVNKQMIKVDAKKKKNLIKEKFIEMRKTELLV